MSDQKIIAFVGMPGSGKGTCTSYLREKYAWPLIHFGDMVYEEVQRRGLDNVFDERFVREDMRKQEGPAVLAKRVSEKADSYIQNNQPTVVFDGLYSWTEYKFLKEKYNDDLIVVAIIATKSLRHQRVIDRKDSHRAYTKQQIITREIDEIENLEKGGPIAIADYYLLNDGTQEELLANLDSLIKKLGLETSG